jgi:indolepyruvate ferredoxin oxidoreductase
MGLGGGTGSGVDPFIDNKQVVFLGDGTFFHSGQVAISHSINAGQDITYIILDNKTTAMTGHQTHPGLGVDLTGKAVFAQDIERIVKAMVPKKLAKDVIIARANPADRDRYRKLLEKTILSNGVKIVIADKECGITYHRKARSEERGVLRELGYLPRKTHMNVATEVCEFCLECTNQTGCPGLKIVDTDYGSKIQTDFSWCVNDGACERIKACPSFEEVTVVRKRPPRQGDEHVNLRDIPDPSRPIHADREVWRCYLAGVGGMGIGLCTAILVAAGHEMGYHVQFLDKKGLAIRNGGVFSQLVYTRMNPARTGAGSDASGGGINGSNGVSVASTLMSTTPVIPYGKADLILGVDLLEAVRSIDPKHPYRVASEGHTAAVVNTAKTPTVLTLMGMDHFEPESLERTLRRHVHPRHYFGFNVGDLCERVLDSKLYANIMMLGIAFQKGFLPLKREALEAAIRGVIRQDIDRNIRAFEIGRKIAVQPELFIVEPQHEYESARRAVRRKINTLRAQFGGGKRADRIAKQFRVLLRQTFRSTRGYRVDDALRRDVVIRAYDCLIWGGIDYARQYCERLVDVFHKDTPGRDFAVTRAVVWNLAKVMLIKDEVYVAAMLTNPEKHKRDRRRFNVNPSNGDKIVYRHHNRPEFDLFGFRIRFDLKSRDWQLRLMSRMRFLRNVLPGWHKREREFREWYIGLLDRFEAESSKGPRERLRWLEILRVPEAVSGYREVRYPKMEAARRRVEELFATDLELFEPAGTGPAIVVTMKTPTLHLPVLNSSGV